MSDFPSSKIIIFTVWECKITEVEIKLLSEKQNKTKQKTMNQQNKWKHEILL